jgi:TPR repeat protein
MRGRWLFLQFIFLAFAVEAADIGGYFHEVRKREAQTECAQWITEAQHGQKPELQYRAGLCYSNGWGVPEDQVAAYRWYAIAAEANHPGARIRRDRLGRLLESAEREAIEREVKIWRPRTD